MSLVFTTARAVNGKSVSSFSSIGSIKNQRQQLRKLLIKYKDSFAETDKDLGRTSNVKHKINTGNAPAFKELQRTT
jgi:hypothetical protein